MGDRVDPNIPRMGELIPKENGDGVFTGLKPTKQDKGNYHEN